MLTSVLSGCAVSIPKDVTIVRPFDAQRYLGLWYEIARLDHSFERGMTQVSATYSMNDDGSMKVINRGYDLKNEKWKDAVGRAEFILNPQVAALKVSFFGPFYGGYFITDLDQENYQWAMIVGNDMNYFWILSREKTLSDDVIQKLLRRAEKFGIQTDQIIWVTQ